MPPTFRKPLGRSISTVCLSFVALLSLVLSIVNYETYKRGLYHRYEAHIRDILTFTKSQIDTDDLAECIRTGEKSQKFKELQKFMDSFKDNADIHYLYIIRPLNTEPVNNVMDIIAAMSTYEKQYMPEMEVTLNGLTGTGYSVESVSKYLKTAKTPEISFFTADWEKDGVIYTDYTGTLPLYTSSDEYIGLLCVDIDITSINKVVMESTLLNVVLIMLLGFAFIALFILWTYYNIANPIKKLENSVTAFAYTKKGKENINDIIIPDPEIHTDNEVESLANAVVKMSKDMRSYVENVIEAESRARLLSELASKDALTNVRNKTAYDKFIETMDKRLSFEDIEFAVAMIDLNHLKMINDNYGHEHGNDYIKKSCSVICHIFSHSPIFRIGGDEFVVVMQGEDYDNRENLINEAIKMFESLSKNMNIEPWERISAAIGMAIYSHQTDATFNDVFNRADKIMYANKAEMKKLKKD